MQNGTVSELELASKLIKNGITPYAPYIDQGCDLVCERDDKMYKVQIKSTYTKPKDGKYQLTIKKGRGKSAEYVKCDIVAINIADIDVWYFVPCEKTQSTTIYLRPDKENCKFAEYKENWKIFET